MKKKHLFRQGLHVDECLWCGELSEELCSECLRCLNCCECEEDQDEEFAQASK